MIGSLILISSASFAQPVLTATGINPVIGESSTSYTAAYVAPGGSGPGQTWNFSSMSGTSTGLTSVVAPSSTPHAASFPNANISFYNPTSAYASYYKTSTTALQNYGTAGTVVIPYTNPEDMLHFPFTYLNTFTDAWTGQFQSGTYTYTRKGTTTVTADGYGTLITPGGTFTNVLRVHFVENYTDSTFAGSSLIITYHNDEYMWYKEGVHVQIAFLYTLTSSSGGPFTGGGYTTTAAGIENGPDMVNSYNLYPNPATDQVNIDFSLIKNQQASVQIFNALGQCVKSIQNVDATQGANTLQLDVADMPKGIYVAQIMLQNNVAVKQRFVVAK